MSKIAIDETEYCQKQHALKHYALLMKAIAWRNATLECYYDHQTKESNLIYFRISRDAKYFLDYITQCPIPTLYRSDKRWIQHEQQIKQAAEELLA